MLQVQLKPNLTPNLNLTLVIQLISSSSLDTIIYTSNNDPLAFHQTVIQNLFFSLNTVIKSLVANSHLNSLFCVLFAIIVIHLLLRIYLRIVTSHMFIIILFIP